MKRIEIASRLLAAGSIASVGFVVFGVGFFFLHYTGPSTSNAQAEHVINVHMSFIKPEPPKKKEPEKKVDKPSKTKEPKETEPSEKREAVFHNALPVKHQNKRPKYPDLAWDRSYEGKGILEVEINENGTVDFIRIEKSSGYSVLDKAAIKAIRKWKYIPAKKGNRSIRSKLMVPFEFKLTDHSR